MSQPLTGKKAIEAEKFYDKLIGILLEKKLPFMIGGTYAFNQYTGLDRPTGDIDIKCTFEDYPRILKALAKEGYETSLAEIGRNWLAKVKDRHGFYTDLIFGERNGLYQINPSWLANAKDGVVLGHKVKLEPIEDLLRSKMYVQNRDRADVGDVVHLILRQGQNINWKLLLEKTDPHWELLMAHILFFLFIYPSERDKIPAWVIDELMKKLKKLFATDPPKEKNTRGLLLSTDYEVGVAKWGFSPITELK
jgi:hypothetical protein